MTAYRSTNTYREDLLRYDGTVVVNVTVTLAVIAGTSTTPAVTVTEGSGVTVTPAVIAATSTAPAVTVSEGTGVTVAPGVIATAATTPVVSIEIRTVVAPDTITATTTFPAVTVVQAVGVTVNLETVSVSGLVPESTITTGQGTSPDVSVIATTATIPSPTITAGTGQTPILAAIEAFATISIELETYAVYKRVGAASLDVLPYYVSNPQRRWKSHLTGFTRPKNIVILTDGTVTDREPHDRSLISKVLPGGREVPLTEDDLAVLVGANYSTEVK